MARSNRNIDVGIRIKADLAAAKQGIDQLRTTLDGLGASGKNTASDLKTTASAANQAASSLKADAAAADAAAKAHGRLKPAVTASTTALQKGAVSAKQYQMAMRQLPMQMTDIATGLATGQSPFMVLMQQGGQLKDSFGGVGAAARAVAGAISPLAVAVGVGAGAVALMTKAMIDGYREMQAYERALISTGNVSGTTAGHLTNTANRVGEATGAYREAEEAALALAQSGKFTGETLDTAIRAAVDLATLTGMTAADAAEQIATLADKPSEALAKLNQRYHFLTLAEYEHVRALEAQGRAQEASTFAVETFGRVHEQRVQEAISRQGFLERAGRATLGVFRELWQAAKDVGRTDPEFLLRQAQTRLEQARSIPTADPGRAGVVAEAEAAVREAEARLKQVQAAAARGATQQRANDAAIAASAKAEEQRKKDYEKWAQLELSNLDKKARLEREIKDIRALGLSTGKTEAEIETQIAAARARYAESVSKGARGPKSDADRDQQAAERELENLQQKLALLRETEEGEKRVGEAARIRYEVEQGSFAAASAAIKQQLLDQAQLLDAEAARREKAAETKRGFEQTTRAVEALNDALRTPAEVALETAIARVETLNQALADGIINAEQYNEALGRVTAASFEKPPSFEGLSPEVGGIIAEQTRLDDAKARLEAWYADQQAALEQARLQKSLTQEQWNAHELAVEQAHQDALARLSEAQTQVTLMQAESAFDSLAQIAKTFGGEQSKTYKVLFAISKSFAIAQAAIALAQNVAEASKAGYPQNIPLIAGALAQGVQIASLLTAAAYAQGGRIRGPGTGTSDDIPIWASNGEFMVRERAASEPGASRFLDDFNNRGMAALADWRGYAEGGLVTNDEPRLSDFPVNGAAAPAGRLNSSLMVGLTDGLVLQQLDTDAGQELLVKHVSRNPAKFRGALGL